jgi:hypothetical protein
MFYEITSEVLPDDWPTEAETFRSGRFLNILL